MICNIYNYFMFLKEDIILELFKNLKNEKDVV